MFLTSRVPASVPSRKCSSKALPPGEGAVIGDENSVPFTSVRSLGFDRRNYSLGVATGLIRSFTWTAPASVPSLVQSSTPEMPSSAVKNSLPFPGQQKGRLLGPDDSAPDEDL